MYSCLGIGQNPHYGFCLQVDKWFQTRRHHTRVESNKNGTNNSTKEMMVEKPNEGIKQDSPLKQDIGGGLRTNASTPNSSKRPQGESRVNHGKSTSSSCVGRPKDGDGEYVV